MVTVVFVRAVNVIRGAYPSNPASSLAESPDTQEKGKGKARHSGTWDAPITVGENNTQVVGLGSKQAEDSYLRLMEEAQHIVVGPMPVHAFLDVFMDRQTLMAQAPRMPPCAGLFEKLRGIKKETAMYEPLVSCPVHYIVGINLNRRR